MAAVPLGARFQLTDSTNGVQYFIVTAITSSTITLYGGNTYSATHTITLPYYSLFNAIGFDPYSLSAPDQTIFQELVTETSSSTVSSPTSGTMYNVGSYSITLPVGSWNLELQATGQCTNGTVADPVQMYMGLTQTPSGGWSGTPPASSSVPSDPELSVLFRGISDHVYIPVKVSKPVTVSSVTTYYLFVIPFLVSGGSLSSAGFVAGADTSLVMRAKCGWVYGS